MNGMRHAYKTVLIAGSNIVASPTRLTRAKGGEGGEGEPMRFPELPGGATKAHLRPGVCVERRALLEGNHREPALAGTGSESATSPVPA